MGTKPIVIRMILARTDSNTNFKTYSSIYLNKNFIMLAEDRNKFDKETIK